MSCVPLPWWASQSNTSTRSPRSAREAAVTAALLIRQKPIALDATAWWPGGLTARNAPVAAPDSPASTAAPRGPASPAQPRPRRTAGGVPRPRRGRRVGVETTAAAPAQRLQEVEVARRVNPLQLAAGRLAPRQDRHLGAEARGLDPRPHRVEAGRTLRVGPPGIVFLEALVGRDQQHVAKIVGTLSGSRPGQRYARRRWRPGGARLRRSR